MSARSSTLGTGRRGGSGNGAPLTRYRFSVDDYHAMAEAGILTEDDRVELLDGEVVEMTAIGSRHAVCVGRLTRLFSRRLDDRVAVWVQNPIRLDEYSAPEPDIALLQLPLERYADSHPAPGDVLLVVEVADVSLERDRTLKLPLYAGAGIAEVWIVDLEDRAVEVCRDPSEGRYSDVRRLRESAVTPLKFPDETIRLDQILGPGESP